MTLLGSRITHLRCDNPGPLTLTGTNTYVVRGDSRVVIVDPGPGLDEAGDHQDRIVEAAAEVAGRLADDLASVGVDVVLTHHHADHAGGADPLVERLRAGGHDVRIFGATHGLALGQPDGLKVLSAPGHTTDSIALVAEFDDAAVLFSGDTILGGSSSFIAHPDGNLTDYLETLETLRELTASKPYVLAPGHGELAEDAHAVILGYQHHRAARLDEVRAALAHLGDDASVEQVADVVYADIDAKLRPAAEAVVSAQLEHLRQQSA